MGYRWTKEKIEANNIVESRQHDQSLSNFASVINGGVDRDNLPTDCIGTNSVKGSQMGKCEVSAHKHIGTSDTGFIYGDSNYGSTFSNENTRGNAIKGWTYERDPVAEGGFFIQTDSQTIDCEEGMLNIQWKCSSYMPMYWSFYKNFTTTNVNRHRYQWQLRVDGIIVYTAPAICQPFFTVNLTTMIPISKGTHEVSAHVKFPDKTNEDSSMVIWNYWGGQFYLHNYFR